MATVTITFTDCPDVPGKINTSTKFDPPLTKQGVSEDITPAQRFGLGILDAIAGIAREQGEVIKTTA